jgi:hypothetical protein
MECAICDKTRAFLCQALGQLVDVCGQCHVCSVDGLGCIRQRTVLLWVVSGEAHVTIPVLLLRREDLGSASHGACGGSRGMQILLHFRTRDAGCGLWDCGMRHMRL